MFHNFLKIKTFRTRTLPSKSMAVCWINRAPTSSSDSSWLLGHNRSGAKAIVTNGSRKGSIISVQRPASLAWNSSSHKSSKTMDSSKKSSVSPNERPATLKDQSTSSSKESLSSSSKARRYSGITSVTSRYAATAEVEGDQYCSSQAPPFQDDHTVPGTFPPKVFNVNTDVGGLNNTQISTLSSVGGTPCWAFQCTTADSGQNRDQHTGTIDDQCSEHNGDQHSERNVNREEQVDDNIPSNDEESDDGASRNSNRSTNNLCILKDITNLPDAQYSTMDIPEWDGFHPDFIIK